MAALRRLKRALGARYGPELETLHTLSDFLRPPRPAGSRGDREYARFLKNKRVALVGPAPTVAGSGQGGLIDAQDVVVRLNHAFPIPAVLRSDVGERTDILYHNMGFTGPSKLPLSQFLLQLPESLQWVCSVHPYLRSIDGMVDEIDAFLRCSGDQVRFRTVDPRHYLWLRWRLGCMPNAGVSAIQDLRRFEFRDLYITGFTFYSGPAAYYDGYRGRGFNPAFHDRAPQVNQVKRWVARDRRIAVDRPMQEILFPGARTPAGGSAY